MGEDDGRSNPSFPQALREAERKLKEQREQENKGKKDG